MKIMKTRCLKSLLKVATKSLQPVLACRKPPRLVAYHLYQVMERIRPFPFQQLLKALKKRAVVTKLKFNVVHSSVLLYPHAKLSLSVNKRLLLTFMNSDDRWQKVLDTQFKI